MRTLPSIKSTLLAIALLFGIHPPCKSEIPLQTSLCEVLKDPGAFDHKLILVTGSVSRGFEDFTLSSEDCPNDPKFVWLEFGGKIGSRTVYCCGDTNNQGVRKKALKIDDIETSLTIDYQFKRFQAITNKGEHGSAKAVLIGRFFAGSKQILPKGPRWVGFGHFGLYSLLVIQQVIYVESN